MTSSKTSLTLTILILSFLAFISVAGVSGTTNTILSSIPGNEMSCTVKKLEVVPNATSEFLVLTDGCSDTSSQEKTFTLTLDEKMKANFLELGFQHGIPAGTTLNIDYAGLSIPGMELVPRVTRLSEDPLSMMPY